MRSAEYTGKKKGKKKKIYNAGIHTISFFVKLAQIDILNFCMWALLKIEKFCGSTLFWVFMCPRAWGLSVCGTCILWIIMMALFYYDKFSHLAVFYNSWRYAALQRTYEEHRALLRLRAIKRLTYYLYLELTSFWL